MMDVLKALFNACNPNKAADQNFYVDTNDVRGSGLLLHAVRRRLELVENGFLCFFFSGHIGSGKSSELVHLRDVLTRGEEQRRFLTVMINANDYLNPSSLTIEDLLLAIVTELACVLREQTNIELSSDQALKHRFQQIASYLDNLKFFPESGLSAEEMRRNVQGLRKNSGLQKQIRDALAPKMASFLDELNYILDIARDRVRAQGFIDVVMILDNLEKFDEQITRIFDAQQPQLGGIRAHMVYTVPLATARGFGTKLSLKYGTGHVFVLPMIKVHQRRSQRDPYLPGVTKLKELVKRRLPQGVLLEQVFEHACLDELIRYSGGNVRQLMTFIQAACTFAEKAGPVTMADVKKTIGQQVKLFSTEIPDSHWRRLVELDRSEDQSFPQDDAEYQAMLTNLSVLEYVNGEGATEGYDPYESWYAVNPVVRELRRFKSEEKRLSVDGSAARQP